MNGSLKAALRFSGVALSASALTVLAVKARAAGVPEVDALTYTGYLESAEGAPLTGAHSIEVQFWEGDTATDALCSGNAPDTELQSGRFQVALPKLCADAVKASPDVWVDVSVDGASLGRTKLGAVPYALEAGHASTSDVLVNGQSGFRAQVTSNQLIPNNVSTKVVFDDEEFDLGDEYDPATGEFTPAVGGFYFVQCALTFEQAVFGTVAYWRAAVEVDEATAAVNGAKSDGQTVGRAAASVLKLEAGSVVTCMASHEAAGNQAVRKEAAGTHFEASRLSISE